MRISRLRAETGGKAKGSLVYTAYTTAWVRCDKMNGVVAEDENENAVNDCGKSTRPKNKNMKNGKGKREKNNKTK